MDEIFESERPISSQENTTTSNNSINEGDDANTCDEENTRRIIGELQSAIQPIHPPRPGVSFSLHDDAATALKSLQGSRLLSAVATRSTADASTSGEDKSNATELNEAPSLDSCQENIDGLNQQIANHSQNPIRTVLDVEQNEENVEAVEDDDSDIELVQRQELTLLRRESTTGTMSGFINVSVRSSRILEAILVEDVEEGEVVEAEHVGFMERKWKIFASAAGALVLALWLQQ